MRTLNFTRKSVSCETSVESVYGVLWGAGGVEKKGEGGVGKSSTRFYFSREGQSMIRVSGKAVGSVTVKA